LFGFEANELIGHEMIFELTQLIESYLEKHNKKPQSFYDQMLERQKQQKLAEYERELRVLIIP
jgi:hypothetical protein